LSAKNSNTDFIEKFVLIINISSHMLQTETDLPVLC